MSDPLNIGVSGLLTAQRALAVTSNNVSNANTEGYSRQRTDITNRAPVYSAGGYLGAGANVTNISRVYDAFLNGQVVRNTSIANQLEISYGYAAQLDNLLADPQAGLTPALQDFFAAAQGVANDPTSIAARQVLLTSAESLVNRFDSMSRRIDDLRDSVNMEISSIVPEINTLAGQIASLNNAISRSPGIQSGRMPNDLLDKRDQLVLQLSRLVDVQVVEQSNFAINIYIGNGQSLVTDSESQRLSVMANPYDSSQMDIGYANGSSLVNVTSLLTGGRLGGLIEQRTELIAPSENSLGRIAVALSDTFNRQHRLGMDLNSALGGDFFAVGDPEVLASSNNGSSATVSATITDPDLLSNSDYRLSYDGSAYTLVRLADGRGEGPFGGMPFTSADGFSIDVTGGPPAAGDSYLIRPTRGKARSLELLIDDPAKIAAAAPVRVGADLANSGSGRVELTAVSDTSGAEFSAVSGALTPPLLVEFDPVTPNQYRVYDNSNPGAPLLIAGPASYDPATGMDVVADNGLGYGYELRIEGEPGLGDRFTVEYNSQGTGDNSNMLALAGLQTSNSMLGGTASFLDAYAGMVTDVGTRTYQTDIASQAQQALLRQAVDAREAVSGVNLDEEAANMMRFQQAYQASAQVISAAQGMFDALLSAVRR